MWTMTRTGPTVLGLFSVLTAYTVFRAATDVVRLVSPQGCRMSWMSPSYVLQADFNTSWTPLASRYSLLLYREVGWESNQANGLPVLFIPGNAGSSHQVRSIASSATRQYYSSPFAISEEFTGRGVKPLDFYAVEFNEDLSAFHGPTLDSQIAYTSAAVKYILSLYPPDTRIIVMGHSMGGVVGTALLPSDDIAVLITMSTPHTHHPALDARIQEIYDRNRETLAADETPVLSICGGATDMMIPSESCVLPDGAGYRRTVFTSALEGAWTGVGHREMVWCHQVRWRVARAALELGHAAEPARVLDRWLRTGEASVDVGAEEVRLGEDAYELLSGDAQLVLRGPHGRRTYLVPVPGDGMRTFGLYVLRGSVLGVAPHHALDLNVSVRVCTAQSADGSVSCNALVPNSLRLLPAPIPGKLFPVPDEGSDESEGIVFFEAELPHADGWVGVTVDAGDDDRGWVTGGFDHTRTIKSELGLWSLIFGGVRIPLARSDGVVSKTQISLPGLPFTALLAYRVIPKTTEYPSCRAPLFSPLLAHTSQASETHYYRLTSDQPIFLHTHSSGPYISFLHPSHVPDLTIYSSEPSCQDIAEVHLSIDWWVSLGRMGTRYPTALASWGVGIVSLLLFRSWSLDGQQLSVGDSLRVFVRHQMPALMAIAGAIALLPLGPDYYLGVGSELGVLRAVLAVTFVGIVAGMVCITWWLLVVLMWPLRLLRRGFTQRKRDGAGVRQGTVISMVFVLALILFFVPWQVAFLGCWITQLFNCNATLRSKPYQGSVPTLASTPTLVHAEDDRAPDQDGSPTDHSARSPGQTLKPEFANAYNQNAHILLFMTWLLPLAVPVLVVWVRTIQTAGYTTPFNGDHNVFKVAPFLVLVDLLGRGRPLDTTAGWRVTVRWGWVGVAAIAFLMGGQRAWVVYDAASVQTAILLVRQIKMWVYG